MTFAEKLRTMRKKAGFSQEELAEKLSVSRQAVTKWETEAGTPDLENIMAISALFGVSIDEMLSGEKNKDKPKDFLFKSTTEYDIAEIKRFDLKLGGANQLILEGSDEEKIRICLASNTLSALQNDCKVKMDDTGRRLDVEVIRKNGVTEAALKEALTIFVSLPNSFLGKVEAEIHAETVELNGMECEIIELSGKVQNLGLNDVVGTVEVNSNLDMNIICHSLCGAVEINQVSATSRISVPKNTPFRTLKKGVGTSIFYEKNGKRAEDFSTSEADNVIELNGIKTELVIFSSKEAL